MLFPVKTAATFTLKFHDGKHVAQMLFFNKNWTVIFNVQAQVQSQVRPPRAVIMLYVLMMHAAAQGSVA